VREGLRTLPGLLQQHGFVTQAVVTQVYLSEKFGLDKGFDGLHWMQEARAREVTDRAVTFLRSRHDEDFFLFLHYFDPHFNYDPPPPYDRTFDPNYSGSATGVYWDFREKQLGTISARDLQHILALYDGEIFYTDSHIRRLLQEMKQLDCFDNALIVVTSDHGEEFLEHGGWGHGPKLYEELIRVPLLFKLPGGEAGGQRVKQQVSLMDVAPTILDLLDVPIPDSFQGRSLLAKLLGDQNEDATVAWAEVGTDQNPFTPYTVSLRQGQLGQKLIFRSGNTATPIEVYDLARDPRESRDLSLGERDLVQKAKSRFDTFLSRLVGLRQDAPSSMPVELAPEHLEQLRALGYVPQD
jgi:arylsulfatase A-like enzyme